MQPVRLMKTQVRSRRWQAENPSAVSSGLFRPDSRKAFQWFCTITEGCIHESHAVHQRQMEIAHGRLRRGANSSSGAESALSAARENQRKVFLAMQIPVLQ